MDTTHFHSNSFIRLLEQDGGHAYLEGSYRFHNLHNGLSLHGGRTTACRNLQCSRLAAPYVNFVVLLEGCLDFAINRKRYRIPAESGKIVLVATAQEILFRRYLHAGETTAKLSLKGLEGRLKKSDPTLFAHVCRENVRSWPLSAHIRSLAIPCLNPPDCFSSALHQEAASLQLAAALWHEFQQRFPIDLTDFHPASDPLSDKLDGAYRAGAHHVAELAAALHISERTLQRRLQNQMGITASEWLRHKHMQYALAALAEGRSIGETAYRCGYRHVSSFTQAFKHYFNCTPAQWRQQNA